MKTRSMGFRAGLALAACAGAATAWAQIHSAHLSPNGYGAVRIGMTLAQAQESLGEKLVVGEGEQANPDCYHLRLQRGPTELAFMMRKGRVVRISIYQGPSDIATDKGIRVGDPIAQVKAVYGPGLEDEEHEYLGPEGRYLTWWNDRTQRGIRYETDVEGRVNKIHAGDGSIRLVEGCS